MHSFFRGSAYVAVVLLVASSVISLLAAGGMHREIDSLETRIKDLKPQELFTLRMQNNSLPTCQHFVRYRKDSNRFTPYLELEVRHQDGTLEQISVPGDSKIRLEPGCSPDAIRA